MRDIHKDLDLRAVGLYTPIIDAGMETIDNMVAQVILMRAITHGCGEYHDEAFVRVMSEAQVIEKYGDAESSVDYVERVQQ